MAKDKDEDTIIDIQHYGLGGSVEDQAVQWLARLRGPEADVAMQAAFAEWLNADSEHQAAFDEVLSLWEELGPVLETLTPEDAPQAAPEASERTAPRGLRFVTHPASAFSAAATVLITCAIMVLQLATPVFETRTGEQSRVMLPDGSVAHLNTQTTLRVAYDAGQRRIEVLTGEAWFDVKPDRQRPFTVSTAHLAATATGTAYAVRSFEDSSTVAVTEGSVVVMPLRALDTDTPQWAHTATLVAGQQARVRPDDLLPTLESQDSLAWREGQLVYENVPLAELLRDLDRYLPKRMVLNDDKLAALRVSAVLNLTDQDTMLEALQATLPLKWKSVSDTLIIVSEDPSKRR